MPTKTLDYTGGSVMIGWGGITPGVDYDADRDDGLGIGVCSDGANLTPASGITVTATSHIHLTGKVYGWDAENSYSETPIGGGESTAFGESGTIDHTVAWTGFNAAYDYIGEGAAVNGGTISNITYTAGGGGGTSRPLGMMKMW